MDILVFTNLFPNYQKPQHGIFIKKRVSLYKNIGYIPTVMVPVPWFPLYRKYNYHFVGLSHEKIIDDIRVIYFKYINIPKIGMIIQPFLMLISTILVFHFLKNRKTLKFIDGHYLYPDGVVVYLLNKFYRLPYILSARGTDVNVIFKFLLPRKLMLKAIKKSFRTITVSNNLKKCILDYYHDLNNLIVIPNGVDKESFSYIPHLSQHRKQKNSKRILMVGNLIKQKGQHLLVDALKRYENYNPAIRVYFVGMGELSSFIKANSILANGIRLIYLGFIPNDCLVNIYNKMDLFCLLSESEGNPNVVLEALASGLPVLATNVGDLSSIINEDNGYILESRDIKSILKGLEFCLNKNWDREKISKSVNSLSWEVTVNKINTIFSELVSYHKIAN